MKDGEQYRLFVPSAARWSQNTSVTETADPSVAFSITWETTFVMRTENNNNYKVKERRKENGKQQIWENESAGRGT